MNPAQIYTMHEYRPNEFMIRRYISPTQTEYVADFFNWYEAVCELHELQSEALTN